MGIFKNIASNLFKNSQNDMAQKSNRMPDESGTKYEILSIPSAYDREFEENSEARERYAKTIFLFALSDLEPIKDKENYQHYLKHECQIEDPVSFHKKMINEGYLEKPTYKQILKSEKVVDLKEILAEMGLAKSGTKDILINRIVDNTTKENILRSVDSFNGYTISEKGSRLLKDNDEYIRLHRTNGFGVGLNEYEHNKMIIGDDANFGNIILYSLREHIKRAKPDVEPSYMRSAYLDLAKFMGYIGDEKESLLNYLMVLHLDTSGTMQYDSISLQKQLKEIDVEFMELSAKLTDVAPGIASSIYDMQNSYIESMVDEIFENIKLPVNILTKDNFKVILNEIMANKDYDEAKLNKMLYDKFMEYARIL